MAITANQQPQSFQPVYNPYVFVLSSDNSGNFNFKINFVVVDSTDSSNPVTVATLQNPTNTNGYAVFDLSRVIRDYITDNFSLGVTLASNCGNSIKRFTFYAQEVYSASASGTPVATGTIYEYGAIADTTSKYLWNAALPFDEFDTYQKNNYLLKYGTYTANKWLTNGPIDTGINMSSNQNAYGYLLCENLDSGNANESLVQSTIIKTYNSAGSLLGTYEVDIDFAQSTTNLNGFMIRIPVGTYNIAQIGALDFISGSQPIITSNVSYYTVHGKHPTFGQTYGFRVNIVDYCNSPQMFRLHWLNRLGGFDCFNFDRYYTETSQIERKFYKRPYGNVTSGSWSYAVSDRNNVNMINTSRKQFIIQTNWISETEAEWLEELMTSPVVYLEESATVLKAVNIIDTSYETKYRQKDKVFNLSLTIELTYDYKSQTY
jgi:hypothetical protein